MEETRHCSSPAQQRPNSGGSNIVCVFQREGLGGLVRVEEKLNTVNYGGILSEDLVQSTQNWAEGSPSNRTMTLSTQLRQY